MNDFTNFDPYAGYAADYGRPLHVNGCDCDLCVWRAKESAERMRAATCKCGHVGAECFNDSYCTPNIGKVTFEGGGAEVNYYYANVGITEYNIVLEQMDRLGQIINDLQADYAADCVLWHAIHAEITDEAFTDDVETQDRIEALETTIKVLSGMIE